MKFLLDQNISFRVIPELEKILGEVAHVKDINLIDTDDFEIWQWAKRHEYSIITFDGDFYDFSSIFGSPPKIIWIRTGNLTTKNFRKLIDMHKSNILDFSKEANSSCLEIFDATSN